MMCRHQLELLREHGSVGSSFNNLGGLLRRLAALPVWRQATARRKHGQVVTTFGEVTAETVHLRQTDLKVMVERLLGEGYKGVSRDRG